MLRTVKVDRMPMIVRDRRGEIVYDRKGNPKVTYIQKKGYRVIVINSRNKRKVAYFGHSRVDEYAHARFIEENRSADNGKPYRNRAQKELARQTAFQQKDGAWFSPTGKSYHADDRKKPAEGEEAAA